jgi:hypothetical protein
MNVCVNVRRYIIRSWFKIQNGRRLFVVCSSFYLHCSAVSCVQRLNCYLNRNSDVIISVGYNGYCMA